MKIICCKAIALENGRRKGKFELKEGKEYTLVDYSNESKAYTGFGNKKQKRVIKFRDVFYRGC